MTLYTVSTTDRKLHRHIEADSPNEAMFKFVGKRCATGKLNSWTADGKEWFYDLSVNVENKPFRMGTSAIKSISGHVYIN